MYFNQHLAAARTQKLVETLFSAIFRLFCSKKNISTSFWVCPAPKSWSKYTTIIVSNKSQKPINGAEPMLSWPKLIEKPWIERELLKWHMIERRSTQIFDAHFYGQILFAESNMHRNIFCCICKTAAKTLLLLKTSWEGWFGGILSQVVASISIHTDISAFLLYFYHRFIV